MGAGRKMKGLPHKPECLGKPVPCSHIAFKKKKKLGLEPQTCNPSIGDAEAEMGPLGPADQSV